MSRTLPTPARFDVEGVREQFPALHQQVHGRPLVYLDNAATTQKPRAVLDAVQRYYTHDNANIHRGVHALSQRATEAFEAARGTVQRLLGAADPAEVIFTRGTTEAINLVAASWSQTSLHAGDEIVLTAMEHHSDIVPWQMACERSGARLRVVPVTDVGVLDLDAAARIIGPRTRLVGVVHVSNVLGTVNPLAEIAALAHAHGALVLGDGAQAVAHRRVDVQALGVDFYAFSGHKLYGPTGVGALWGRRAVLEAMPPWQGGGDMIRSVTFERTVYAGLPSRFEAGTPDIAGAIGLGAAIDWLEGVGIEAAAAWEDELLAYGTERLSTIEGLHLLGTAPGKVGVLSFVLDGIHPHDVGTILDQEGVAIRTGHHCAQPLMERFGVPATSRASLALYNTREDLDALVAALGEVRRRLGRRP